jgi:hypothetical protein
MSELTEIGIKAWQRQWVQTTKGAIKKEYFPVVNERLKKTSNVHQNSQL